MKQHITIAQWDEITNRQKDVLDDYGCKDDWRMNIGQMIEFLGSDINDFIFHSGGGWTIILKEEYYNEELCDLLWEAVKYKLKQ